MKANREAEGGAVIKLACLTNLMSESESGRGTDILKLRAQNLTRMNDARLEIVGRGRDASVCIAARHKWEVGLCVV